MVREPIVLSVVHGQPPSLALHKISMLNISKAELKLTVLVRPEDAPRSRDDLLMSSGDLDKEEELATEIYVPLVHYAHEKYVAKFQDHGDENTKTSGEVITDTPGGLQGTCRRLTHRCSCPIMLKLI